MLKAATVEGPTHNHLDKGEVLNNSGKRKMAEKAFIAYDSFCQAMSIENRPVGI